MSRLQVLVKSEFDRLNKYNLFKANFVVLLFWLGIAWFLEGEHLRAFVPLIFLIDATIMAILLTGATLFYEKQEHTLNALMVSPVTEDEYLLSKVVTSGLNALFTVVFVGGALYLLKGVTFNYVLLVPAVLVVTTVHTLIGIRLSYHAKTFTGLLVNMVIYNLVFLFPTLFAAFGIISADAARYLIVLPPEASHILINAGAGEVETWKLLFGYGYLLLLAFVLYRFLVKPAFNAYAMRETGV